MKWNAQGFLIIWCLLVLALLGGCRCEKLGESDCNGSYRCRGIFVFKADPEAMCLGERIYRGCERAPRQGEPQADTRELLRDEEGRYWLADPRHMPEAEAVEGYYPQGWSRCSREVEPSDADSGTEMQSDGGT